MLNDILYFYNFTPTISFWVINTGYCHVGEFDRCLQLVWREKDVVRFPCAVFKKNGGH